MPLFRLYVCSLRALNLDFTMISQFTKCNAYRNDNICNVFSPSFSPSWCFSLKLSVSLKNYTVNMASPAVLSLLFSARCSFGRFPPERTLRSYLKVMEPACIHSARLKVSRTSDSEWAWMSPGAFAVIQSW